MRGFSAVGYVRGTALLAEAISAGQGGAPARIRTCGSGILPRVHSRNIHPNDRGCTKPGRDAPAYHSKVHHVQGWKATHRTAISDLALACGPDKRLVENGGFGTRKNAHGDTEWIPPAHLDRDQPRTNTFHPAEKLLAPDDDEPDRRQNLQACREASWASCTLELRPSFE